jgi:hypothetical protein
MAATGYTPIILFNSTSAGNQPTTSNLAVGELALNVPDGKLYYNNSGTITLLATAATASITLPLSIANGGTNGASVPTAGAVPYGTGTAYAFTAAGTAGQVLTSQGSSPPIWAAGGGGGGISTGKAIAMAMIFGF